MKTLFVNVPDPELIEKIHLKLKNEEILTPEDLSFLKTVLSQLSPIPDFPVVHDATELSILENTNVSDHLGKWLKLFQDIPESRAVREKSGLDKVILHMSFLPFYDDDQYIFIELKSDSTAEFHFETMDQAKQFPELFIFKGGWKEAYISIIQTMKKGWPQEQFPQEFAQFFGWDDWTVNI